MKMFSIKSDFSTLICETSGKVVAVFIAKSGSELVVVPSLWKSFYGWYKSSMH